MGIPIPVIDSLLDVGREIIKRKWPDPKEQAEQIYKLEKLAQDGDLARLQAEVTLLTGQIEINKIDAASGSRWQAGWRPAVGWVGAAAFAYSTVLEPLARFGAVVIFDYDGAFPVINEDLTLQVLLGLLGLGAFRSYDKTKGSAA